MEGMDGMDGTERLIRELSEARGTVGREDEVREIVARRLRALGEVRYDRLGSAICELRGESDRPRVMIAAHMDEIGFLVRAVTEGGFLRLKALGGWLTPVLPGQRMAVQTRSGDVPGVVGARPPHGIPPEERTRGPAFKDLYVDIGAGSREEVLAAGVRVGDAVVPAAPFARMHDPGTYVGKAFDDRVGCALLVELLEAFAARPHPNTLVGVATVQEEPLGGEHGAAASVHLAAPDVAIVLECGGAQDTPEYGAEGTVRLGGGPTLSIADEGLVLGAALHDLVVEAAGAAGIPLQLYVAEGGNTDGKAIQHHAGGVPTVSLAVPMRYAHCHSGVVKRSDYDRTLALLALLVGRLDAAAVAGLTDWGRRHGAPQ